VRAVAGGVRCVVGGERLRGSCKIGEMPEGFIVGICYRALG